MDTENEQLILNEEYASGEVRSYYFNKRGGVTYLVKVSFTDVGFYINGITVDSSKHPDKGLWVQLPRYFAKGKWRWPVEANKGNSFFWLVEKLSIRAVEEYTRDFKPPTPEEVEQPITLDDLNFDDDP